MTGWTTQRERGSIAALRLMAGIAFTLGWRAANLLLHPITLFYLATAPARQREAARRYLSRALGRAPGWADLFRLYFGFASTMLDRAFLLTGRLRDYEVEVIGRELLDAHVAAGRGCILLGAHLGCFDALRAVAGKASPVEVRALMRAGYKANAFYDALDPESAAGVIPLGTTEAMLQAKECLDRGGMLGILGDRAVRGERMVVVPFLGRPASLPAGPMQLAAVLGAPVVLCFGLRLGPRRYELRFEPFADRILLDRARREEMLRDWVRRYAARLEELCRAHPFNWFNFYDFWNELEEARA